MMKLSVLFAFLLMASPVQAQDQGGKKLTPVIVANVEKRTITDEVEALGTLKANESVVLTSTVTEMVTAVHFEDGQRVEEGYVLVEMDAEEEKAELSEQKSYLEEAQRQVNRLEPLVKKGAASESILDERRREVLGAKARIEAIEARVNERIIKAPFDGVIGLRNISQGALAQPGSMIATIDDDQTMKLDFSVPEVFLSTLKPGLVIEAESEAFPDKPFKGTISSVDSRIDPITRSIQARALIENKDGLLKPGLLMQVVLQKNPRETIIVPEEALTADGSENFVLVIERSEGKIKARRQKVDVGQRQFGIAEILQGLNGGDQVVTHGNLRVRPGTPLEITAVEKDDETLTELLEQNAQGNEAKE